MKKIIVATAILIILSNSLFALNMNPVQKIDDSYDDVIIMSLDSESDTINFTDEKPNLDITKITYFRADNSNEVSITLEVKGEIENVNDFEDYYNLSNLTGGVTTYLIYLETTNNTYEVSYIDENLEFSYTDVEGEYSVNENELIITFELLDGSETFVSFYAYSMSLNLSETTHPISVDIAPNDSYLTPYIQAPKTGVVGEEIKFYGDVEVKTDYIFGLSSSLADDLYVWDFDDRSDMIRMKNPTHIYYHYGNFMVMMCISSNDNSIINTTHNITITQRENIYDVNFDDIVDINDVIFIWKHRKDYPINSVFDVNCDNKINFQDMFLVWRNKD